VVESRTLPTDAAPDDTEAFTTIVLLGPRKPSSDVSTTTLVRLKRPLRYLMGLLYVIAGVTHFRAPDTFERVVPPQLPAPRTLVYLSGVAEILLGVGVLFKRTRRESAFGLIALLVAVFPANVYMATSDDFELGAVPEKYRDLSDLALWARLPLQVVLIAWAWWYTGDAEESSPEARHDE
jgi:uncharacterized membrane protein